MTERIAVTDIDIVREHRIRRLPGSPINVLPALRICLANCAALRKKRAHNNPLAQDGKRLAAGDID